MQPIFYVLYEYYNEEIPQTKFSLHCISLLQWKIVFASFHCFWLRYIYLKIAGYGTVSSLSTDSNTRAEASLTSFLTKAKPRSVNLRSNSKTFCHSTYIGNVLTNKTGLLTMLTNAPKPLICFILTFGQTLVKRSMMFVLLLSPTMSFCNNNCRLAR